MLEVHTREGTKYFQKKPILRRKLTLRKNKKNLKEYIFELLLFTTTKCIRQSIQYEKRDNKLVQISSIS